MLVFAISLTWDVALINKPRVVIFFPFFVLKQLNTATMHFLPDMQNHEFGNQTIEMHCFARENQTYTGTWLFGVESWKSLKGQENLLLKNLQVKTRVENVRFLSWRIFFVGKYSIQSTNEMAFKRTVTLLASFRFPTIRFHAPTLL